MAWTNYIYLDSKHINSFGSASRFYLETYYQYNRDGNTVYYQVKEVLYYMNASTYGGSGYYGDPVGGTVNFNSAGESGYKWFTGGGTWSSGGYQYTYIGEAIWDFSITNTTGTGTVPCGVYANNTSGWSFDNPGWYWYSLAIPPLDTYTVTYDANGGRNAPAPQSASLGTSMTLSEEVPIKDATLSSPYVVTFDANGGSIDVTSKTSYIRTGSIFNTWNTASDGTGTSYAPGDTYTGNANITLYAQWFNNSARDKVILPDACKNGYRLIGYGPSASSSIVVVNPYTPTGDITLYAIWEAKKSIFNYKNGSTWTKAPVVKVKVGDSWYIATNIQLL